MKRTLIIILFFIGIVAMRVFGQNVEFVDNTLKSHEYNTHIPIAFLEYSAKGDPVWNASPTWALNKAYPVSVFMNASLRNRSFELIFLNYDTERPYTLAFRSNFSREANGLRTFAVHLKPARGPGSPFKRALKFPMRIVWGNAGQELRRGIDPRQWFRDKTPFTLTFLSVHSGYDTIFYR